MSILFDVLLNFDQDIIGNVGLRTHGCSTSSGGFQSSYCVQFP